MEHEHGLVNWTLIPPFLKEAIIDFPFESTADAQDFSNLMVSRMRCRLLQAPELDDSAPRIERYLEAIEAELVSTITSNSFDTDHGLACRSTIYRQMLLCQLSDPQTCIL